MNINDVINLNVTESDIICAIRKAKQHRFIDNLRERQPIVSFDSKVRGYIGEISIGKWLGNQGITGFADGRFDANSCDVDLDISSNNAVISCEIKTSRIPERSRNMNGVIDDCDIKIIRRPGDTAVDRDIYIQIYFGGRTTKAHDDFLKRKYSVANVGIDRDDGLIYRTYEYSSYINNTFFVAWDHKRNIEARLNGLPENQRTYSIGYRQFYVCKLHDSLAPAEIVDYIRNYNR